MEETKAYTINADQYYFYLEKRNNSNFPERVFGDIIDFMRNSSSISVVYYRRLRKNDWFDPVRLTLRAI